LKGDPYVVNHKKNTGEYIVIVTEEASILKLASLFDPITSV
jgi:hypothetical protein